MSVPLDNLTHTAILLIAMSGSIKKDIAAGRVSPPPLKPAIIQSQRLVHTIPTHTQKTEPSATPKNPRGRPKKSYQIDNISKFNEAGKATQFVRGRKRIAKTLEIYVKQYLMCDLSVRHFRKWADAKPGEALPWAWKVVYGDGAGTQPIGKGQVNVLIQILTGKVSQTPEEILLGQQARARALLTPASGGGEVPRGTCQQFDAPLPIDSTPIDTAQSLGIPNDINGLEAE